MVSCLHCIFIISFASLWFTWKDAFVWFLFKNVKRALPWDIYLFILFVFLLVLTSFDHHHPFDEFEFRNLELIVIVWIHEYNNIENSFGAFNRRIRFVCCVCVCRLQNSPTNYDLYWVRVKYNNKIMTE